MTTCPCCGQPIAKRYAFDHLRGELAIGKRLIKFGPCQADLFAVLERDLNHPVTTDRIIMRMYGVKEPEYPKNCIAVFANMMRKKLAGTPFQLGGERRGYMLSYRPN